MPVELAYKILFTILSNLIGSLEKCDYFRTAQNINVVKNCLSCYSRVTSEKHEKTNL